MDTVKCMSGLAEYMESCIDNDIVYTCVDGVFYAHDAMRDVVHESLFEYTEYLNQIRDGADGFELCEDDESTDQGTLVTYYIMSEAGDCMATTKVLYVNPRG